MRSHKQHAQGASGEGNPNSIGEFITSFVKLAHKCKFSEIDIQYEDIKVFFFVLFLWLAAQVFCV